MRRRHFLSSLASATLIAAMPGSLHAQGAQTYPSKPIRIIVPFAPGGTSDVLARSIGQKLTEMWGQPVVVENRPGAGGNIGAEAVARAQPDGQTLLMIDIGTLTISPSLFPKLAYDPIKDLAPVTIVAVSPHALVVHPSVPATTVQELIAYAKANPGTLNFANPGNGTLIQLAGEQFKALTGITMTQVPYKGGAQALVGVMGGEVHMTLNGMLATLPHIKSGKLRALAIASTRRLEAVPDLPTISEAGVPGFESGSWQGLLAPAGTPKDIIAKLNTAVVGILNAPEMKQQLVAQGTEVVANSPEQFAAFLRDDLARWTKIVKDTGIKAD
jgi:tripartite-type tricarboxylate transporter receptor subunit TctC